MKKILLFIGLIILVFLLPSYAVSLTTETVQKKHAVTNAEEEDKDIHLLNGENDTHKHSEDEHKDSDSCGVEHLHDPYLMASVLQEPWRHPEWLGQDMWLTRIIPVLSVFLVAFLLRPGVNKLIRKVGK